MPSCIASSFSHGEAFISSKPERTITFTSSPPRRFEERQQSIAVLPPPSTITRLPILSMWPNETLDSQSMPMWMLAAASWRPGTSEIAAARRPAADENRVEAFAEQLLQAVDVLAGAECDAEIEDVPDLFVDHRFGQAKARNLRADHAARARIAVEDRDVVTERREIARDGERGRTGADERDALAVLLLRGLREPLADVVLVVGADALQPADRDGLRLLGIALFHATASARGLAGPIARAAENAGEDVRFPVDHVGIAVAACRDQPDVFGDGGMGGARPLAIDNFMKIVGVLYFCGFQGSSGAPRICPSARGLDPQGAKPFWR